MRQVQTRGMRVTLSRPAAEEYDSWSAQLLDGYIAGIIAASGLSRAEAEVRARRETAQLLPNGFDTPGQLIFRLVAEGQPVGWLWLSLQHPLGLSGVGFIYDIVIDEAFRGRGYGREAMQLAELEAKRHGLHALALNVFAHNDVARGLYASLGYRETSVRMQKDFTPRSILS